MDVTRPSGATASASRCRRWALAAAVLVASAVASPATAWLVSGHRRVTLDAVALLPDEVPAFFRSGTAVVSQAAVDPDLWRNRGTPALADRVGPEHYIDLELLRGSRLPERREDYHRLLGRLGVEPARVGALPYAIVEDAERLALSFAEHRRWPADEAIRAKCLLQAGWLAHFAGDLIQPLHTTVHHDGRTLPNGDPPFTGIHRRVDGLFDGGLRLGHGGLAGATVRTIEDLSAAVGSELAVSHSLVDAIYGFEGALLGPRPLTDPRIASFAAERHRAAARFIAEVLLWSWKRSAQLELPEWLER